MYLFRCLAFLLLSATITTAADLSTVNGRKVSGDVLTVDSKTITMKSPTGNVSVNSSEVVLVDLGTPQKDISEAKYVDIELLDGSLIHASAFVIKGVTVEVTLLPLGAEPPRILKIPLTAIFSILREGQDAKNRADFQTIIRNRGKRDILIYRGETKLDGSDGTFGNADATGKSIEFVAATDGVRRNPLQKTIHGMVFNQLPTGDRPVTVCKLLDVTRNVIYVKAMKVEGEVLVTTAGGVEITYPDMKSIHKLDFSSASIRYLSDLDPKIDNQVTDDSSYRLSNAFFYSKDKSRSEDSPELRVGGQKFAKGVAIAAGLTLAYDIGGDYREFRALVGIDDYVKSDVSVRVTIEADARVIFNETIKRGDAPKPINVDVRNVKQIRVLVESPDGVTLGREIDLADARVTK